MYLFIKIVTPQTPKPKHEFNMCMVELINNALLTTNLN